MMGLGSYYLDPPPNILLTWSRIRILPRPKNLQRNKNNIYCDLVKPLNAS